MSRRPAMKHLPLALVLLAGAVLAWVGLRAEGPAYVVPAEVTGVPRRLPTAVPEGYELQRFEVEGMCTCSGCPPKLYDALLSVEAVTHAAVDPATGQAKAHVVAGTDPSVLAAALTFEDYAARPLVLGR